MAYDYDKDKTQFCEKCHRVKNVREFYRSFNPAHKSGYAPFCKQCMTMHVDNWDSSTFVPLLEELNVPWVPGEWNECLRNYAKDPSRVTGLTILGRYLSRMALKQYKDFRYSDTEFLQNLSDSKIKMRMEEQGHSAQDVAETIELSHQVDERPLDDLAENALERAEAASDTSDPTAEIDVKEVYGIELTEDDKTRLMLKWGKSYRPDEWIQLEQLYNEMEESYDIQTAGHTDILKFVCKTSLKMNQLIDINDVDGFQKMSKVYDSLMKSGKFTAAQNKAESGEGIDSIGEIVALCEKQGFIPRYYTDGPQDKVDKVLSDFQEYTKRLVTEEMSLGNMIESSMREIMKDKEKEADLSTDEVSDDDRLEDLLFSDGSAERIKDEDFQEFKDFNDELEEIDEDFLNSLIDGDGGMSYDS